MSPNEFANAMAAMLKAYAREEFHEAIEEFRNTVKLFAELWECAMSPFSLLKMATTGELLPRRRRAAGLGAV